MTNTEIGLLGVVVALISALMTGMVMTCRFVTRKECDLCKRDLSVLQDDIKRDFRIVFRMVRALVVCSDLPENEKVNLLNDQGADNG